MSTHARKLENLGISNDLGPCNPSSVVFNYSSVQLSYKLKILLAFSLDFNLPIYKLDYYKYFLKFESFASRINKLDYPGDRISEFMTRFHAVAIKYFYNFKSCKVFSAIFSKSDISLLRTFSNNKNIIVCKPDKGRGVVVVDRDVYCRKMQHLISDNTKFEQLLEPIDKYTRKIEDKVNNFLRKIKNKLTIPADTISSLFASGSAPGILYGLPKIHKPDFATKLQFRPIFAAYKNPCFKLAKYIVSILNPYSINEYSVSNSSSFVSDIKQYNKDADKLFMASFDIESLYTNVPLKETINIIADILFPDRDSIFLGLDRALFIKLLEIGTMNSFFIFNNMLYKQLDGLGMGLPHSPAFANIFLAHHEKIILEQCPMQFRPIFYRRYMDDTFVLFKDKSHATKFLNFINQHHPNILFTMETEVNSSLPFLDVNIIRNNSSFQTSVYRKSSFSGLGMSYFSFCTNRFKNNGILTLLHRAYVVCSNFNLLHEEFQFLIAFFNTNGYPINFIQSKIKYFLDKIYVNNSINNNSPSLDTLQPFYVSLPYFGHQSEKMKIELMSLLKKYFINHNFNLILTNSFTIGSLFGYKDALPVNMLSSVVYKYSCPTCGSAYVGSTIRNLATRVCEHAGVSVRTGVPLSSPPFSHIREHHHECNSPQITIDQFKTINSINSNDIDLRILESLYIHKTKPILNTNQSAYPLYIVNR